eukprot:466198-Prorocentrum_minimum.AAC.29
MPPPTPPPPKVNRLEGFKELKQVKQWSHLQQGDFVRYFVDCEMRHGGHVKYNSFPDYIVLVNYARRVSWSVNLKQPNLRLWVKPRAQQQAEREARAQEKALAESSGSGSGPCAPNKEQSSAGTLRRAQRVGCDEGRGARVLTDDEVAVVVVRLSGVVFLEGLERVRVVADDPFARDVFALSVVDARVRSHGRGIESVNGDIGGLGVGDLNAEPFSRSACGVARGVRVGVHAHWRRRRRRRRRRRFGCRFDCRCFDRLFGVKVGVVVGFGLGFCRPRPRRGLGLRGLGLELGAGCFGVGSCVTEEQHSADYKNKNDQK